MTTNQTIDGVPRELLSDWLKALSSRTSVPVAIRKMRNELRALMDVSLTDEGERPAAQPQGEPVAWMDPRSPEMHATISNEVKQHNLKFGGAPSAAVNGYSIPLYAEQSAPVAVVPDGYCIMPRQLTAENGAKSLLLGEFKLLITKECPECCELEEPTEGCSICDGEGEYGQKHTIPWDQIKFIYSKAVSGLAVKAESAKSR